MWVTVQLGTSRAHGTRARNWGKGISIPTKQVSILLKTYVMADGRNQLQAMGLNVYTVYNIWG